jgi:outer membrane protein OmpA-like peptidoglycan-associated protein
MKYIPCLLACLLLAYPTWAQTTYTTKNAKAIRMYEEADELFKQRRYDEGMDYLKKAVEKDANFVEAHYKMATTYELFFKEAEAQKAFHRVVETSAQNPRFKGAYYKIALYEMRNGNYGEAKKNADNFLNLQPTDQKQIKIMQKVVGDCEFAVKAIANKQDITPIKMPSPLNQHYLQYYPYLTGDQKTLVYTARETPAPRQRDSDENVMVATFDGSGWSKPTPISPVINSPENEGAATISADGRTIVYTSCDQSGSRPNYGQCDLYVSTKTGDNWTAPVNLGKNVNSRFWESQPTLSADGKTLYFISTREGGKGGKDIWFAKQGEDGKWQPAQNLTEANTELDETSPFIHPNGKTLFFSSNGRQGMGALDIYKMEYINKQWTAPENLGYPINDYKDQFGLFVTTDGLRGMYSVDKFDGDTPTSFLYEFNLPAPARPSFSSNYVKGTVYDSKTKAKLEAKIDLFDLTSKEKQASITSDKVNGGYMLVLNQGAEYGLEVHRKGYAFKSLSFNYAEGKDIKPLEIDIELDPIAQGTIFTLNNIFFEYNKYELQDKSKTELDALVKFLQDNPDVKGEVSGHTDNIGAAENNMTLSLNRAHSVRDYLVNAGIDANRLTYKGFGSTKPATSNDTEEGRAKNRRIEFKVL